MSTERLYRELHWGDPPTCTFPLVYCQEGPFRPYEELTHISYVTTKNGSPEIYEHSFKIIDGRGPYLLEYSGNMSYSPDRVRRGKDTAVLGRVIDVVAADGRVILTPGWWVLTDERALEPQGGPVILAHADWAPYALEQRKGCPFIKPHGIID